LSKKYNKGVKDALRILYQHINTMEHAVGFSASNKAQDHTEIMKSVYNNVSTLLK